MKTQVTALIVAHLGLFRAFGQVILVVCAPSGHVPKFISFSSFQVKI